MDKVTRIGVSLEPELLNKFDEIIEGKGYASRSEAIRDLVRDAISDNEWKHDDSIMTGVVVMLYDTTVTSIYEKIDRVYKRFDSIYVSNSDTLINNTDKMSAITVNGKLADMKSFITELMAIKGVKRGRLTMVAPNTGNIHHIGLRG